jgi:methionine-rich copper-binding protein CopC
MRNSGRNIRRRKPFATSRRGFLLLLPALLLDVPTAQAHAMLERASPAVGSTVRSAPTEVTLRFTEALEPAFSTLQVTGPGGERVDAGDTHVDGSEKMILRASLKPLTPGVYTVVWRVVSIDTHVTNGDFKFTVAP